MNMPGLVNRLLEYSYVIYYFRNKYFNFLASTINIQLALTYVLQIEKYLNILILYKLFNIIKKLFFYLAKKFNYNNY